MVDVDRLGGYPQVAVNLLPICQSQLSPFGPFDAAKCKGEQSRSAYLVKEETPYF